MMKYNTIFARSFSQNEQRKLGYGAFVGCLIIAVSFCMVFKPYLNSPLTESNLRLSTGIGFKLLLLKATINPMRSHQHNPPSSRLSNPLSKTQSTSLSSQQSSSSKPPSSHLSDPLSKPQSISSSRQQSSLNSTLNANQNIYPSTQHKSSRLTEDAGKPSLNTMEPLCKTTEPRCDYCDLRGDIRIHGKSSTIFVASPSHIDSSLASNRSWVIQPYARKGDRAAMGRVTKLSVELAADKHQQLPNCTVNHGVPAIVFSLGGYAGNHFHDFTDIMIPLYAASRKYNGEVQFLVTEKNPYWITKYQRILRKLSKYEVISINGEDHIRCFPQTVVGLYRWHRELSIDPSKSPHSMRDFRVFLRSSYSLNKTTAIKLGDSKPRQPRLLIISRRRSRTFINEGKIAKMARRMGFTVIVAEATSNLSSFALTVNSCDIMMGVHGAGLTNMVFLPERAILVQVVPLGMEWLADYDFGKPAAEMNIRYLQYRIRERESTLRKQYPHDHVVFRDPLSIQKLGWEAFRSVYLDKQNVKLDVARFGATLSEALQLLHQ